MQTIKGVKRIETDKIPKQTRTQIALNLCTDGKLSFQDGVQAIGDRFNILSCSLIKNVTTKDIWNITAENGSTRISQIHFKLDLFYS